MTVPATKATTMNIANRLMMPTVCTMAKGELMFTLPRLPIWIWSTVVAPKVSRKNRAKPTQSTGLRHW